MSKIISGIIPCISLYQPWATWVIDEDKGTETRTHAKFRCLQGKVIGIHASKKIDRSTLVLRNPYADRHWSVAEIKALPSGMLLGTARVSSFRMLNANDSKSAMIDCKSVIRYGLILEDVNKFDTPIPVIGEMGIWYFDLVMKQKVKKPKPQPELF